MFNHDCISYILEDLVKGEIMDSKDIETQKVVLKNDRTDKILKHCISEIELRYKLKTEHENLRHKHIMDELEFMKKNGIKDLER